MLIINTKITESPIHGLGLYTLEDLVKGQIVWMLHKGFDAVYDQKEWNMLIKPTQDYLRIYMYWSRKKKKYVACLDNARFMNHSLEANTHSEYYNNLTDIPEHIFDKARMTKEKWALVDLSEGFTIASRDICAGEELSANYNIDFPDDGGESSEFMPE